MAMERNITNHISKDRCDRVCFILKTIGLGKIIKEQKCIDSQGRVSYQCLTDTGVLQVLDVTKKITITLYIASQPKVSAMYEGKTPSWVFKIVRKNRKYAEIQNDPEKIKKFLNK